MNEANFVKRVGWLVSGDGFRKIQEVKLSDVKDATGLVLTAATVPAVVALETNFYGLSVVASQTHAGRLAIVLPRDYDEGKDELRIRILAQSAGATNTPTIDGAIYRKRAGADLSADLDPTISDASSGTSAWLEIDADGLGNQAGDALDIVLTTSAHTTDALSIYAVEVYYRSNLAFTDIDIR